MKKLRLRVSYSTRPVSAKVLGRKPTASSRDTKRDGVKKLENRDRVTRKPKEK